MKKFMLVPVALLLVCFMTACCGKGEEKVQEKIENPYLTENDITAFTNAYPVFVEITKKKEAEIGPLAGREDLIGNMKATGEIKEYKAEIDAALKKYGFTLESFSVTHAKIMAAYAYGQMAETSGNVMKKMLENPNLSEEQKEEIRKNMQEAEESEEMKATKKNWEIVKKNKTELENLFKEK
jgi:hypothetical protein